MLVPAEDVAGWPRRCSSWSSDEERRRALGAAAVESARRYDPAVVGEDWDSLIDELRPAATLTRRERCERRCHRAAACGRRRAVPPVPGSTAVLVATAAARRRRPRGAAARGRATTLLARLVAQLASLGVARLHVLTRPAWADAVRAAADGAELHAGDVGR